MSGINMFGKFDKFNQSMSKEEIEEIMHQEKMLPTKKRKINFDFMLGNPKPLNMENKGKGMFGKADMKNICDF